jgi:hypothetical protein
MFANVAPWLFTIDGTTNVAGMTDKMTDIGFDSVFQHKGDHYWLCGAATSTRLNNSMPARFWVLRPIRPMT